MGNTAIQAPRAKFSSPSSVGVERQNRISGIAAFFVIAVAVATDLVQFGLDFIAVGVIINRGIDILFALGLGLWLAMSGVTMWSNPRIGLSLGATFLGEMIPGVDAFPFWTADVIYIISQVRAEDGTAGIFGKVVAGAGGLVTGKLPAKGVRPPPLPKQPPPLPKETPPLPKRLPNTAAVPPPISSGAGAIQSSRAMSQADPGQEIASRPSSLPPRDSGSGSSQYEREVQKRVGERARALRELATEYRHGIEERTRRFGSEARSGQEYVRTGRASDTNKG